MSSKDDNNYHYAILMETSGREFESWYNFIRYEGNEENLRYLQKQLEKVDFYVIDELSTFDLELEHLVSEETARQMCLVDLNAYMFHRKFNGKLQKINFGFSKRDDNEDRIEKVYDKIGNGDIDNYLDGEEDLSDENEIVDDEDVENDENDEDDVVDVDDNEECIQDNEDEEDDNSSHSGSPVRRRSPRRRSRSPKRVFKK